MVAKHPEERRVGRALEVDLLAVDVEFGHWDFLYPDYAFAIIASRFRYVTMPSRRNKLYPTPEDAETAFYDAFERGDLAGMMSVWAEADHVVCIHPQGPRLVGFDANARIVAWYRRPDDRW